MAKLYYQGHGSYRLTTNNKTVIYVDPYAGDGYDIPADIILVTHDHYDHNNVSLVRTLADTKMITAKGGITKWSIPAVFHQRCTDRCGSCVQPQS